MSLYTVAMFRMILPLAAALVLCGLPGSVAAPARVDVNLEARRRVQSSALLVAEQPRPRGEESERRSERVFVIGRELLGSSFNATETMAILSHMYVWLASDAGQEAASRLSPTELGVRLLLEDAARAAHPEIGDGAGSRGASQWAQFILATSQ